MHHWVYNNTLIIDNTTITRHKNKIIIHDVWKYVHWHCYTKLVKLCLGSNKWQSLCTLALELIEGQFHGKGAFHENQTIECRWLMKLN